MMRVDSAVVTALGSLGARSAQDGRGPKTSLEQSVPAHFVSPALLSLDSSGVLGVMGVDEANVARFHPIEIVRAESDGVWISGPPREFRLVTVNEEPGFAVFMHGQLFSIMAIRTDGRRILDVCNVMNPDKLRGVKIPES